MSFEFTGMNMPQLQNGIGAPIPMQAMQQQGMYQNQMMMQPQQFQPKPQVDPRIYDTPEITIEPLNFTIEGQGKSLNIPVEKDLPDVNPKKQPPVKKESGSIIRSNNSPAPLTGVVEDTPTAYSYYETTGLLRETLGQIDGLNAELMQEFETVRTSRTMKNKYGVLVGLSENVGSLISNRIAAIKEINSSISKANDLDYKKLRDNKNALAAVDDDKHIADLYKSFITNPQAQAQIAQIPMMDAMAYGTPGIIRADISNSGAALNTNGTVDMSYTNYIANMTPEQRLMMYEGNNNVKQCLVYDASTGNKAFQYFDMSTMQPVPNMPTYSDMLLEEFNIDLSTKKAKSINMKEMMDVIVINDNVTSQY